MRLRKFHRPGDHMRPPWVPAMIVLVLMLLPLESAADTIVLKNGRKVDVEMAWIEEGQVKGVLSGAVVTYAQEAVERIERAQTEKAVEGANDGGFRFGLWASGMSLEDVRRLAGEHALELQTGELPPSEIPAVTVSDAGAATPAIALHYREKLLEKPAGVEMRFTPASERLYGLMLRWKGPELTAESEFFKTVYSNLAQKYGSPRQKDAGFLTIAYRWKIDTVGWVSLETSDNAIEIRYMDTEFEKTAKVEQRTQGPAAESADTRP